jgi:peptidoglycan/xylan/chitin deacetylase (PgdA/CDA1 family)
MRRAGVFLLLLATFLLAVPAAAGPPVHQATPWWHYDLTFWAPFDDARSPLRLLRGTGTLSLTRAHDATHTATYLHPGTGLVTVADNNQLRIEANGALIEGPRENLIARSYEYNNAYWTKRGTLTVAPDNTTDPFGTSLADNVSGIGYAGDDIYKTQASTGVVSPSFFVKQIFTTGTLELSNAYSGTYGKWNINLALVGTGWHRVTRYSTAISSVTSEFTSHADGYSGLMHRAASDPISAYLFGSSLEAAAFSSSFIPTVATAMSRNADVLTIPTAGNIDNSAGTLAMEWAPLFDHTMTTGAAYYLFDAGPLEAYYNATDQKIYLTDGTNTISTAALTFTEAFLQKLVFRWGPSGLAIYRLGEKVASGEDFTEPALVENLYIGSDDAGANQAFANFKNIRVWNVEYGDSQAIIFAQQTQGRTALVTFVYDDGFATDATLAEPVFTAKGVTGCSSIATDYVGTAGYMTWEQVLGLQTAGWEIMSHSKTHSDLTTLTEEQLHIELGSSKQALLDNGIISVTNLVYPGGANNELVRSVAAQYYSAARQIWGTTQGRNSQVISDLYQIASLNIDNSALLETHKGWVDEAEHGDVWLVLYAHEYDAGDATALGELIDYIQAKGIPIVSFQGAIDLYKAWTG